MPIDLLTADEQELELYRLELLDRIRDLRRLREERLRREAERSRKQEEEKPQMHADGRG